MEPSLSRLGGYTILKESDRKQVRHVKLAKGKLEEKSESDIAKFDTSRSIAEQLSDQLRESTNLQQPEKK